MIDPEKQLLSIGLSLPAAAPPAASYVPYVISGSHIFIAGQIPFLNGEKMHQGRLGENFNIQQGQEAAKACALNILSQVKAAVDGDWSRIVRCVRLGGFVNGTADFDQHPAVINGASELIVAALGDIGRHSRAAVGVANLPFGVAVEIDAIFEIKV